MKFPTHALRYTLRKFYFTLALIVIVLAVLVQSGRAFSYLVSDYRVEIAQYLTKKINAKVELTFIKAEWEGLQPVLDVGGISIIDYEGLPLLALEGMRLRIDLLSTLLERRLVWGNLMLKGGKVTFLQNEKGLWDIQGCRDCFSSTGDSIETTTIDSLIDILLVAKRIAFEDTAIDFHFNNRQTFELISPHLLLENQADFHRLLLRVDMDENKNALFFVAEGLGDPRNDAFSSEAHLQLQHFPVSKLSSAVSALAAGRTDTHSIIDKGNVNASIWFVNGVESAGYNVVGEMEMSGVVLPYDAKGDSTNVNSTNINSTNVNGTERNSAKDNSLNVAVSSEISGQINALNEWHIGLLQLQAVIAGSALDPIDLSFSQSSYNAAAKIQISRINAQQISRLALDNAFLPKGGELEQLVQDLNVQGALENVKILVPPNAPKEWELSANLLNVGVSSWNSVPAIKNISGYLYAHMKGGYVNLDVNDHLSLAFPGIYTNPLVFDSAKGQVAWHLQPDNNNVAINSGLLFVSDKEERAHGAFLLTLPWRPNTADIDLTIDLSAQHVLAMQYEKYTPTIIPEFLSRWMVESIGSNNEGIATTGDFIFRGTISDSPFEAKNIQLSLALENGRLAYHPDWPEIKKASADILVDNTNMFATLHSGQIFDSNITSASVHVLDNPDDVGKLLQITGDFNGIADDGLRILRESMLHQYIGDAMDSWTLQGEMQGNVNLSIPLESNVEGAYQDLSFKIRESTLSMVNHDLTFSNLVGSITYNSDRGVQANKLDATLFGQPVKVRLNSKQAPAQTVVDVSGVVASNDLAAWAKRPEMFFLDGDIPYNARVEISHQTSTSPSVNNPLRLHGRAPENPDLLVASISFKSTLEGVQVKLPEPFYKTRELKRDLAFSYILGSETALLDIQYGDLLQTLMHIDNTKDQLLSGAVGIGELAVLPLEPSLHVTGTVPFFDFFIWQDVWNEYQENVQVFNNKYRSVKGSEKKGFLAVPLTTDIVVHEQPVGLLTFLDMRIQTRELADSWDFLLSNADLVGEFNWPFDDSLPMTLALERFILTPSLYANDDADESVGSSDPFDFRDFREANVSVQDFSLAEEDYGQWGFHMKPNESGLIFSDVHGLVRHLTITGEDDKGASLLWDTTALTTRVNAVVTANDMNDVLREWGQAGRIESNAAVFNMNLSWPGAPHDFLLLSTKGEIGFVINDGKFIRDSESSGEGILRLMSLFNFDTIARRLRLDFSDLSGGGLAFDKVAGTVELDQGLLHITDPIALQGASSRMRLTGDINIENETLDTQLVASLPVSGNLTIITALAAGLPAAAGVWIISKLFAKQVSKMTSVSYTITGEWDEPVTKFDHMFDSEKESLKNNKEETVTK